MHLLSFQRKYLINTKNLQLKRQKDKAENILYNAQSIVVLCIVIVGLLSQKALL